MKSQGAVLVLSDGRTFFGKSLGATGKTQGEVVFTTGMAGYQETLTDPSFCEQIITFTYSHIGNYGVNAEDIESEKIYARGLIVRDPIETPSNYRATDSLEGFLKGHRVVGIAGIDTRALTRHIRSKGAMPGLISSPYDRAADTNESELQALQAEASQLQGMAGRDLAHEVSCKEPRRFVLGQEQREEQSLEPIKVSETRPHVVVYDFGMKDNIAASLARRGAEVTIVPASTSAQETLNLKPDGVVLSNGPGDPDAVVGARETTAALLGQVPMFGICLGYQIMALAIGARTYKMKFGHRGVNQPVQVVGSHRVHITSQNHGFAVDPDSLPDGAEKTFLCPNDGTLEGFDIPAQKAMAVQFHPEACPGPHDTAYLFDRFIEMI